MHALVVTSIIIYPLKPSECLCVRLFARERQRCLTELSMSRRSCSYSMLPISLMGVVYPVSLTIWL